jgi:D-alanine-D-alanine ligase
VKASKTEDCDQEYSAAPPNTHAEQLSMTALEFLGKSIAVLCGGTSAERDLSLKGGADVAEALRARGYRVTIVDLTPALDLVAALRHIDVVFVCLHGPLGEDGSVQGFLEVLKIPYTFSGVVTQSVCVDSTAPTRRRPRTRSAA